MNARHEKRENAVVPRHWFLLRLLLLDRRGGRNEIRHQFADAHVERIQKVGTAAAAHTAGHRAGAIAIAAASAVGITIAKRKEGKHVSHDLVLVALRSERAEMCGDAFGGATLGAVLIRIG